MHEESAATVAGDGEGGVTRDGGPSPSSVEFVIPGEPVGKGRPRFVRKTGRTYTPAKTNNYENAIRFAAQRAMAGRELIEGACALWITAQTTVPESWSKKRRATAQFWTGRTDADNIGKAASDAMNGIVYKDDRQVTDLHVKKRYGPVAELRVRIVPLAP